MRTLLRIPTCQETSMLLSQRQDRALGLAQRVGLYLHLAACTGCRRFGRQLVFMRAAFRRYLERDN